MKDDFGSLEERLRTLIDPSRKASKSKFSIKKGIRYILEIATVSAYLYITGPYIVDGFYNDLGLVYAHFGKHEKAIACYTKSIAWEPKFKLPLLKDGIPYSYYNRGN